ncbi:hypothetical protein X797_011993 [Metarhizium robertsii]|uniref:Uncharacterized protein n=1 Tax=Metarhizium robertsii TaxID=568076 RepID=A0A014MUW7_9HYPO|nr:hypothetical protein X797_011993 [Metarhizium robertsii]
MSSLANKDALRAYARDAIVLNSLKAKAAKTEDEEEDRQVLNAILSSINNFDFWHEVEMLAKVLQPIEQAQRCSERDHSCVGEVIPRWLTIQAKWDALEEANQDPLINYSELRQWRVQRMKGQTTDIHHFAFALDPWTTTGEGLGLDTMERAHRFLEENTSNEERSLWPNLTDLSRTTEDPSYALSPLRPQRVGILWVYGSQVGYIGKESSRILGELCSFRAFLQCHELPSFTDKATFIYMNCRVLRRLKMVKDNPAESIVVKNWETVDVARLIKIENAFQDSIVVGTDQGNSGVDMDISQ